MRTTFSLVYPTRHRPDFVRQALRILELQGHDNFDVIVCDNYVDPALSCEQVCRESNLGNLTYVRPPQPVGIVENWNHALQFATGEYVSYLTDKMFVLPGALTRIERVIGAAGDPEIVSWTSDFYTPASFSDYFGEGSYAGVESDVQRGSYSPFSPAEELSRRGQAVVARAEQSPAAYCRGKLVFGSYRRELVERVLRRYGALFHNINPDYTSMVLGLAEAHDAVELAESCVVSVNTDLSNGLQCDTSDVAALAFLNSLAGGGASILPRLLVPGLYVSIHNWVAHDYLGLRSAFDLTFDFNLVAWLTYCWEDVYRPGRRWSDPQVELEQKGLLRAYLESIDPAVAAAVGARINERAAPGSAQRQPHPALTRRLLRSFLPRGWRRPETRVYPSIGVALQGAIARD